MPNTTEDEAVRIFLEFERMESAIKGNVTFIERLCFPQIYCCIKYYNYCASLSLWRFKAEAT